MRLLIADDDDYTREGLKESIDWEQYGIHDVLLAGDGAEALRMCTVHRPDIVLTDIRMPKLNGIEFAEKLSLKSPGSILIFMSGYMDVEYLRSAIKLSAVEYIEKPIKLADVEQAILKSVRALEEKQAQSSVYKQKNELVRQKLAGLLRDQHADLEELLRLCQETGFPPYKRYVSFIVEAPNADLTSIIGDWRGYGIEVIGEQLDRKLCFIIVACQNDEYKQLYSIINRWLSKNGACTVAIGEEASGMNAIPGSFRTARRALDRSFYEPDVRCLRSNTVEDTGGNEWYNGALPAFYKLSKDNPEGLSEWLAELFASMRRKRYPAKDKAVSLLDTMAHSLLGDNRKLVETLANEHGFAEAGHYLKKCETLDNAELFMHAVLSVWMEEKRQSSGYSRLVREVMSYVAANYRSIDLDLTMIAGHMHLSTSYLGKLFKEETGTSIKQYISDYRIDLAKKLVENEQYKMHTIAELCGFASASYFVKVFKAATDLSPMQYRKKS